MRTLVLCTNESVLQRLEAAGVRRPILVACDWAEVIARLSGSDDLAAFIFTLRSLNSDGVRALDVLSRRSVLPCTGVYVDMMDPHAIEMVYPLQRYQIRLLFPDTLVSGLRDMMADFRARSEYICKHLANESVFLARMVALFETARNLTCSGMAIAAQLHMSRSALYSHLHREGLPSVECWQVLFRLLTAHRLLHNGHSTEDAAYLARYANPDCLRKAIRTHLQMTIAELREVSDWRVLVDRWLSVYESRAPARNLGHAVLR